MRHSPPGKDDIKRDPHPCIALSDFLTEYHVAHDHDVIASLSKEMQNLWLLRVLDGDIYNGGFCQFFETETSTDCRLSDIVTVRTPAALSMFGCQDVLSLYGKAAKVYQRYLDAEASDASQSEDAYRNAMGLLGSLDDAYYQLSDIHYAAINEYIHSHVGEFVVNVE